MTKMQGGRRRSSYIPLLLHLETRLDVMLVRTKYCYTIPQARQLISHGKIGVNNRIITKTNFTLQPGDIISFKLKDAERTLPKDPSPPGSDSSNPARGMLSKHAAASMMPKLGTSTMVSSRSFHTSLLKVDADLAPFVPAKRPIDGLCSLHTPVLKVGPNVAPSVPATRPIDVLQRLRSPHTPDLKVDAGFAPFIPAKRPTDVFQRFLSPTGCASIVAALKKGIRRM